MQIDTLTPIGHKLIDIYQHLFDCYGPQHWWPADEPFEVMVGAVLTQSTAWGNVEKAIDCLKAAGAMTPVALRDLPLDRLAALIHPCGYYNVKARRLKSLVDRLDTQYQGSLDRLFSGEVMAIRERLLSIYGIGPETADSILLYAAGRPVFVIDAYTRRIMGRLGVAPADASYAALQARFTAELPEDVRLFNEYHALLVCLGKNACRRRPLCQQCCLNDMCRYVSNVKGSTPDAESRSVDLLRRGSGNRR